MLEKTPNVSVVIGVIGQVCAKSTPPIPPPTPPQVPQPPSLIGGEPPQENAGAIRISTYKDADGNCWRVVEWGGTRYGSAFTSITKTPIDCSQL